MRGKRKQDCLTPLVRTFAPGRFPANRMVAFISPNGLVFASCFPPRKWSKYWRTASYSSVGTNVHFSFIFIVFFCCCPCCFGSVRAVAVGSGYSRASFLPFRSATVFGRRYWKLCHGGVASFTFRWMLYGGTRAPISRCLLRRLRWHARLTQNEGKATRTKQQC